MSATTPPPRFRASDRIHVDDHARQHWQACRPSDCETRADVAWRAADPLPSGTGNALFLRHHAPTGWVLVVVRSHGPGGASYHLVTCIKYTPTESVGETIRRAKAAIREAEA